MASTANKVPKKVVSYAKIAKKATEKPFFEATECSLKTPPHLPSRQIPNTNEKFSFFINLDNTDATQEEIANVIPNGVVGVIPRPDLRVIEFVCENEDTVRAATTNPFQVKDRKPFHGILPRHLCSKVLLVKLANVPISDEKTLKQAIDTYWGKLGTVVDIAPHKFPGKPWLTKRWDLLLELPEGEKKLKTAPVLKLDGFEDTVLATWSGAPKACLRCLIAGHSTSLCPQKNPKVGASATPRQTISKEGQTQKSKEKGPEVFKATPENLKVPARRIAVPATLAVQATVASTSASGATTELSTATGRLQPATGSNIGRPALQPAESQTAQRQPIFRSVTPPSLMEIEEQTTPKKGNKRMAKDEGSWYPSVEEIRHYMDTNKICERCEDAGHTYAECPNFDPLEYFDLEIAVRSPWFTPYLERWQKGRKRRGAQWKLAETTLDGFRPIVEVPNYFKD
jgi:hypothetical protein